MCERTIAKYEEELCPTKEENERQHQLVDAVFKKHQVVLHRTEEEEDAQLAHVKAEEEELCITQEGECLLGQEEADVSKFPLTVVSVKTEEHEDKPPESSQLHRSPNVQQLIGHQEKPPPQLLELKQEDPQPPHIKEEKEELWIPQEGECLLGQEEADLKFPLTVVSVKTEEHEDKPPESSQLHHSPGEEKREAEPPSSSSTQHMTTEADGDHCGGSQADKLLAPLSDSDDTTSHDNASMESNVRTNAGEKTFICSVCAKSFGENFKLIRHMRTHTGEKPFICSNCGKKFSRKETMLSHMKVHTGENLYSCSVCAKGFVRNSNLAQHMKTHTGERPFSCSLCDKSFAVKSKMQIHMRTHTGEKPFSCSECGNRFSNKSNMQIHMRTHTGETLFSCPLCDKRFSVKSNMQTHLRTHARQ
ncbi:zinc finger protein 568-like isoform X4 [Entelurus aequoreus]|uniref:zinc finger protein 568-like isoform X4 n=1 Tax=Entelurus aequoreus TaxID=161455 RepID=UPI002B1DF588|nr:zinc finger protein 568-like isoform X4 [Entelurus aequoreus]